MQGRGQDGGMYYYEPIGPTVTEPIKNASSGMYGLLHAVDA